MQISDAADIAATRAIQTGLGILAVPDPIPVVDELIAVGLITAGGVWHGYNFVVENVIQPYGQVTSYPSSSHPITSTTGLNSERTPAKKQMRSTSRSSYSRRRYYYGKKRKYYRY